MELDADTVEVHNVFLNGLETSNSGPGGGASADSTIAVHEDSNLPSASINSPHQTPMNSRAPSPVFLSPNPARLPSAVMDASTQPKLPSLNFSAHDDPAEPQPSAITAVHPSPQSAKTTAQHIGIPGSTLDPMQQQLVRGATPSTNIEQPAPRPVSTLSPLVNHGSLGGNPPIGNPTPTPDPMQQPDPAAMVHSTNVQQPALPVSALAPLGGNPAKRVREASAGDADDATPTQRRKHPRTSSINTREAANISDAPAWFTNVVRMFEGSNLDACWIELVKQWSSFEQRESYSEVRKLSPKNRPAVVGQWIARARSAAWRPNISDLPGFEREFQQWWLTIQPPWRVSNGKLLKDAVDGDWDCLRRPGLNGIVSVLAALFYWGVVVKEKPARKKAWVAAVGDCQVALHHLLLG